MIKHFPIIAACLFCAKFCIAGENSIVDLVVGRTDVNNFQSYFEGFTEIFNTDEVQILKFKDIKEFDEIFSGRASIKGSEIKDVSWWSARDNLSKDSAYSIFVALKDRLKIIIGNEYYVNDIPNFQDASSFECDAYIWLDGDYIIKLSVVTYSDRGSVSLIKKNQTEIIKSGADYGQYWAGILENYKADMSKNTAAENLKLIPKQASTDQPSSASVATNSSSSSTIKDFMKYGPTLLVAFFILLFILFLMRSKSLSK